MKTKLFTYSVLLVLILFISLSAIPCTIFSLNPNNQHWIGRTFDWSYGHGLVFTNKRGTTKKGLKLKPTDISGEWTSKFGSVTFNQFGKEFPNGGMNEAGLVVEALELESSLFPKADSRASLNELQFVQYLLDNYATIEEAQTGVKNIRVAPVGSKLHYFVCDLKKCMTIEFINRELVTHLDSTLPIPSLANDSYEDHINFAKDFISFGGSKPIDMISFDSLDRFVRASYLSKSINQSTDPIQEVFKILSDVGLKDNRWQILYNQDKKTITFRTTEKLTLQRKIDLTKLNFSCDNSNDYFDLESDGTGLINSQFLKFDPSINMAIIKKSVEMQGLPLPLATRLSHYSSETSCN